MKYSLRILTLSCAFSFVFLVNAVQTTAESGLSVTLTPPLFQLTIGPGENWTSALKVVNNNGYDVTYYAQVVDMQANGETGQSKFIPIVATEDPSLAVSELARWIQIEPGPFTIRSGASKEVHFTVNIPQNAEPGGHYAAILVGTAPLSASTTGTQMRISSYVSSLLFVRIKGDVLENGRIRQFTSDQDLYQTPKADFVLRFENTGNTHLKPEGDVTIYNMWGKERGKVIINRDANFGNVLPKTIRRFEFSWEGEANVFDIGRYSAVVTLSYGQDEKKNISATTYFWVVPVVPVSITLGVLLIFLSLLAWFIRRYIRRALTLERERFGVAQPSVVPEPRSPLIETMMEPLKESVVDLRKVTKSAQKPIIPMPAEIRMNETPTGEFTAAQFVRKYRLFFVFMALLLICFAGIWLYFAKVLVPERDFNINSVTSKEEQSAR